MKYQPAGSPSAHKITLPVLPTHQAKMDKRLKKLESDIAKLQAQKAKLIREKTIPHIIDQMRKAGITPHEIAEAWGPVSSQKGRRAARGSAAKTTKAKSEPKYLHPETGATWSGMGKRPFWIREAEEAGRSRDEFLAANQG